MGIQVEDHLKLVMHIAKRFNKRNDTTLDDLFQEGCIALMKAVDDFDESKKVPFSSFAGQRIQFHILSYLNDINLIRKPRNVCILANKIKNMNLEEHSVLVISEELNESLSSVKVALEHLKQEIASIDFEVKGVGNGINSFSEIVRDNYDHFEITEHYALIDNPGFELKDREKLLLKMVIEGYTQEEIKEATGYKSVRVVSDKLRKLRIKFKQELVL